MTRLDHGLGRDENVMRLLDEAAAREESDMRAAMALEQAPGLDAVPRVLEGLWKAEEPASHQRGIRPLWLTVAASAAALLLFVWYQGRVEPPERGPSGQYLSDSAFAIVEPGLEAARWERIAWSGPPDGRYRLRIRDARDATTVMDWVDVFGANELALTAAETAAWPDRIRIEIEMRGADGSWTGAEARESELRP